MNLSQARMCAFLALVAIIRVSNEYSGPGQAGAGDQDPNDKPLISMS